MYLVQRVQMEARDSFLFFTTLTYDNDHLPHLVTSQDVSLPYADHSHLQLLFKRLRNNDSFGRPFRYLAVSERGKERSRPHFHILWFLPRYPGETLADGQSLNARLYSSILDYWCVNKGTRKFPIYEPLFTFHSRYLGRKLFSNYDTHFVLPSLTDEGVSSVAYYVSKYMMKVNPKEQRLRQAISLNYDESEYESIWKVIKSRSVRSTSFGFGFDGAPFYSIVDYLAQCVKRSRQKDGYPCFFNPDNGKSFPLCPFYKRFPWIYDYIDMLNFKINTPLIFDPDINFCKSRQDKRLIVSRINHIDDKDVCLNFDFLDGEDL